MQLTVTGIFWIAVILILGFWLGKKYPNMLGGVI